MSDSIEQPRVKQLSDAQILALNPMLGYIDNFCDKSEALQFLNNLDHEKLEEAQVQTGRGQVINDVRTAKTGHLRDGESPFMDRMRRNVTGLFNLEPQASEPPAIIRYETGGEYKAHLDGGKIDEDALKSGKTPLNVRPYTGILYLNDNFEGGETVFPRLDVAISPRAGRLVFWQNYPVGASQPHPLAIHAGKPVTSGEKFIISFWMWTPMVMQDMQRRIAAYKEQ